MIPLDRLEQFHSSIHLLRSHAQCLPGPEITYPGVGQELDGDISPEPLPLPDGRASSEEENRAGCGQIG
jgi:hypothetical protein